MERDFPSFRLHNLKKVQIFSDLTVVAVGFGVVAGPGEDRSDQNRNKKFLIRAGAG